MNSLITKFNSLRSKIHYNHCLYYLSELIIGHFGLFF